MFNLFKRATNCSLPRSRRALRYVPGLEALEDRLVPAGAVKAAFAAGSLTLTGDALANDIAITQQDDDRLVITGNNGTLVSLNGAAAVAAVTLPSSVTGTVSVNLLDGADVLAMTGIDLPKSLSINGGNAGGDFATGNKVTLTNVDVKGNLTITGLAGADRIDLVRTIKVLGALSIKCGSGPVLVEDSAGTILQVTGTFSFLNGAGEEDIQMADGISFSFGKMIINTGTDSSESFIEFNPSRSLEVGSTVQATGGAGDNRLLLASAGVVHIGGKVTVNNGAGDSETQIGDDSTTGDIHIGGSVAVTNTTGDDVFLLDAENGSIFVGGSVTIKNGAGGSQTHLAASFAATGSLFVGGSVAVTSTDGFDGVNIGNSAAATTINGSITVSQGAGGSDTKVRGSRLVINGKVSVTAAAGLDTVGIFSTADGSIGGPAAGVAISLGAGLSSVSIAASTDGAGLSIGNGFSIIAPSPAADEAFIVLQRLHLQSAATVTTGAGNDRVFIDDVLFSSSFTLKTGLGNDTIDIERDVAFTANSRFRAAVSVNTGGDNDTVNVGDSTAEKQAVFNAASTWDGSTGATDTLDLLSNGNLFALPPVTLGFETVT